MTIYCKQSPYREIAVLGDYSPVIKQNLNFETLLHKIAQIVCTHCNVSIEELKSADTKRKISEARFLVIYLSRLHLHNATFKKLGIYFNRDHSTIIYAAKTVKNFIEVDRAFKSKFEFLEREVLNELTN
jgi:chromosomal replication initiator protein